jgi:predicted porin
VQKVPTIVPHGNVSWKGQYDSDGHLKKHREELQLQFYYFKLRLGSQELLSYRRDNFEAYFGQVSTLEFHSHIPLDTLWGAALLYPIGKFRLGAFLDTSKTFNARVTFKPNRENEIGATFWKFADAGAINVQARTTLGQISAWYQFGQDRPLVKIQLQSEKKHLSWKTTAYIHGDSLPLGLNLSKGIAENRLWASQTVNAKWPEALNTALSAKVRVLSPIASDSVSARFKMTLASGPARLRPSLSVTCIEASNNCNTTEWNGTVESAWEPFSFKAGTDLRYDRTNSAKPPKIELGASYRRSHALAKLSVAFPKTNPSKGISVQNEVKLDNDWLNCNFVFAFKKTKSQSFKQNFAHILTTLKF